MKMDRAERATEFHSKGYNCCQAVVCAFADVLGVDESLLYRVGEGFGAGMGNEKGVCGAMSGAAMVAGLVLSDGRTDEPGNTKKNTYKEVSVMQDRFVERVKRLYCGEIKTGNNGERFTSCDDCIVTGVRVAEEVLGL